MPANTAAATTPTKKISRLNRPRLRTGRGQAQRRRPASPRSPRRFVPRAPVRDLQQPQQWKTGSSAPMPTGSAAARHAFEISSAGVVMKRSSRRTPAPARPPAPERRASAHTLIASNNARFCDDSLDSTAVMRMCSPRRSAMTAPSIASQMNSIEASSSDQTSGRWNTKRADHAGQQHQDVRQHERARERSRPAIRADDRAARRQTSHSRSSKAASRGHASARRPERWIRRPRHAGGDRVLPHGAGASCSCQLANRAFEDGPGFVTVLALPFGVETGLAQLIAEGCAVGLVESHPLGGQILLQAGIQLGDVGTLLQAAALMCFATIACRSAGSFSHARRLARNQKPSHMWLVSEQYFCTS